MSNEYRSRQDRRKSSKSRETEKKPSKKKRGLPLWKKLFMALVAAVLIVMTIGAITAVAMISGAPDLDPEQLVLSEAAEIYDQNGEQITRLQSGENRTLIDINEVPDDAKSAFIAVEDSRFYDHFGIDFRRLGGAVLANVSDGFGAEGASTITQQVVKNAFLSPDKTIARKVQEQYLAVQLEQQYSKDQILEMYLNLIYFNQGAYGIGEASSIYFNKEVSELEIEDAALLAAIPRRPSYYDPLQNPENSLDRRNLIIHLMEEQGFITADEAEQASSVSLEDQLDHTPSEEGAVYDSFISHVQNELENIEGITSADLYSAGMRVYTTLDRDAQDYGEEVVQTNEQIAGYPDSDEFQVGYSLIDTQTGAIKAMVGNRQGADVARGYNYATGANADAGSTIKPIVDYGPAIENNQWSTYHQLTDEEHAYSDGTPIRNSSRNYAGEVSMREALTQSLNIPALKTLQETGLPEAEEFAEGLGIEFDEFYESAALGSFEPGVSSLDMAGAYAAFGNGGTYNEPYAITRIEFPDGREIEMEPESTEAMNDYTAYMITDMLKDVVTESSGTGGAANIPGLPLAGKTGTTNFTQDELDANGIPEGGVPDVWFTGYTSRYTASVWTGFSGDRGANYMNESEREIAKEIFRLTMDNASNGIDTPDFEMPDSVEEVDLVKSTGERASGSTSSSDITTELIVKGNDQDLTAPPTEPDLGSGNDSGDTNNEPVEEVPVEETVPDTEEAPEEEAPPEEEATEEEEVTPEEEPSDEESSDDTESTTDEENTDSEDESGGTESEPSENNGGQDNGSSDNDNSGGTEQDDSGSSTEETPPAEESESNTAPEDEGSASSNSTSGSSEDETTTEQ
ncbi:transglycosylase domain-containing protein [Sinobaca sp. H24]|uniref:transglycosylase domain-containing protein n=1 Tax=Sinobaca sp. H24 TaxID=2923376 RepID=UPI002079C918|nr:PBP1A family penicillin-binding protein [Sinobaca sp. H24]